MDATRQLTCSVEMADAAAERTQKLVAVGGILGAVAASSCCIVPLLLFSLGVSGAWIGNLTRLAPYQPIFVAMTLAVSATATGLFGARAARPALKTRPAPGHCPTAPSLSFAANRTGQFGTLRTEVTLSLRSRLARNRLRVQRAG
jgi:hypothetical protein